MSQQPPPPRPPSQPPGFPPNGPAGPPNRPPMGPTPNRPAQPPQQPPFPPPNQQPNPRPHPPQGQPQNRPPYQQQPYRPAPPQGPPLPPGPYQQRPNQPPPRPPVQHQPARPAQQSVRQQAPVQQPPTLPPPVEPPARERPKRKPEPKTSLAGRVVGILVVLALAAATVVLSKLEVMPSDRMPPFATEGKRGEVVTTNSFKVRVDQPIVAKKLEFKELEFSDLDVRTTSGVWLVVPAAVQAQKEPEQFAGATLMSKAGKKYVSSNRIPTSLMPGAQGTSPGIAYLGVWVFEVPPEEIPGSQLWLSVSPSSPELASQARVDLGLGEDVVEKAVATYDLSKESS